MTKPLLSELVESRRNLLTIAMRVVQPDENGELVVDESGLAILGDAVLEAEWFHPWVMPLVFDIEVNPRMPGWVNNRADWAAAHDYLIRSVSTAWPMYVGRHPDWAKAVLAALLFGDWLPAMKSTGTPGGTRSPWRVVRALANRGHRHAKEQQRAARAAWEAQRGKA